MILVGEAPRNGSNTIFTKRDENVLSEFFGNDWQYVHRTSVVLCSTPGNRPPTIDEQACCAPRLIEEIKNCTAPVVMSLGKTATEYFLGPEGWKLRGTFIKYDDIHLMPSWHPGYVLRQPQHVTALREDIERAARGPAGAITEVRSAPEHVVLESPEELIDWIDHTSDERVTYDLETNQVTWYDRPGKKADPILMSAFKVAGDPVVKIVPDYLLYDFPRLKEAYNWLFKKNFIIAHNGSFDNIFMRSIGIKGAKVDFDTIIAKYCLDELPPHGLKNLAHRYFGLHDYEGDLVQKHLRSRNDEYSKVPFKDLATYAAWDVFVTEKLAEELEPKIREQGMWEWPFMNLLMRTQESLARMQMRGVRVDVEYLKKASRIMFAEMESLKAQMAHIAGVSTLNPNSSPQLATVIWDTLDLPPNKRTKLWRRGKHRSTAKEAVEHLSSLNPKTYLPVRKGHEFVDLLVHYRRVSKIRSSFIDNVLALADVNGRVHPSGRTFGTEVGRLAFSDPAIQTIPRPGDPWGYGAAARGAYIPDPGHAFIGADYSQAELRVLAAETKAPFLLQVYREGRDLHAEVAAIMYGSGWKKEQRVQAKMWNFAYTYGGSEYSFAQDTGMPLSTARELVGRFNDSIPEARQYKLDQFQRMVEQGYVQSRFGRKRRSPPLITNANVDEVRKSAVHAMIAGGAHDCTLLSLNRMELDEGLPNVIEVHDSIYQEVPEAEAQEAADYLGSVMQETAEKWYPEVPWVVDPEIKSRWNEPPDWLQVEDESASNESDTL